jgi:hypothetical protein
MIWKLNGLGVGNSSRQGAKAPSLEGKDINTYEYDFHTQSPTLAAFASLLEIFRDLVAALPRYDLHGDLWFSRRGSAALGPLQ